MSFNKVLQSAMTSNLYAFNTTENSSNVHEIDWVYTIQCKWWHSIFVKWLDCFVIPSRSSAAKSRLYEMFEATDKWYKMLYSNCKVKDWNSLSNNASLLVKILYKINKLFIIFFLVIKIIHTMLLLGKSGVP